MICIFIFLSLTFYSSPNFHTPRTKLMQQHAHHHTAAIFLLPRDRGSTASCLAVSVSHGATSYLDRPPCGVFYAPGYFWYYTLRKDNGGGPLVVNWPVICTLLQQSSHLPRPVRVQQLRSCLSLLLAASYSSENLTECIPFHRIDTQTYTTHQAKLYCSSRFSCVGTAKPAILTVHARCLFHPPSPLATAIPEPNNPDNTTCLSPEHIGFYDQRWSIPHSNTSSHAGKAK